eukprot:2700319-Pyramimonas_sp.AAC.1
MAWQTAEQAPAGGGATAGAAQLPRPAARWTKAVELCEDGWAATEATRASHRRLASELAATDPGPLGRGRRVALRLRL